MPQYHACWVSDEKAGNSRPNIVNFYAANDTDARAIAAGLDGVISGDLMSLTVDHYRDNGPVTIEGNTTSEGIVMFGDGGSQAASFVSLEDGESVMTRLKAWVKANPGGLRLFRNESEVDEIIGSRSW